MGVVRHNGFVCPRCGGTFMTTLLTPRSSLHILGVRVDDVTADETLTLVERFVAERTPHQICTVNPEFVMRAQQDELFRNVINSAALCIPDGVGLLWAAGRQGHPLRERVAGSDMVEQIAARAAQRGWRMYFLGAAPGVADRAAAMLQARYAGLVVAGTFPGSPALSEEVAIVERICTARPDVLLVAFGAPAQDVWLARNQPRLQVPVAMGVGGSLDFIAGVAKRAPVWVQRTGLEWLYRLILEPRRWRRQLALPSFVWHVLHPR
jgi:N-acetylglucosaminyldiphosphoundecaprenol N-acetyl-beta-D-mannosaminyltransferase